MSRVVWVALEDFFPQPRAEVASFPRRGRLAFYFHTPSTFLHHLCDSMLILWFALGWGLCSPYSWFLLITQVSA